MTKKIWIGNMHPASQMYRESEARTVGKALVNSVATLEETVENRKRLKGHMNILGLQVIRRTKALIKAKLGIEPELVFSQMAGCGMCPCSPGFKIKIAVEMDKNKDCREEDFRGLFKMFGPLSYTRSSGRNWRTGRGVRDLGLSFHGVVKAGRVKIVTKKFDVYKNKKAFKTIKKILRG